MPSEKSPEPGGPAGPLLTPAPGAYELRPHTSAILEEMVARFTNERVQVDEVVGVLHGRAYGVLLLLVAIAAMVPLINIVGAVLTIWIGVQMILARPVPSLPGFVRRRSVETAKFKGGVARLLPSLHWLERFVRPRLAVMTNPGARILLGVLIAGLGFLLLIPVPFSQLLPGIAAILLAVSLMERDGLLVLAGIAASALAGLVGVVVILAFWRGLVALFT
jgi:hypothetical protein